MGIRSVPFARIADILSVSSNNKLNWDFGFRGGINDRDTEELHSLLQFVDSFSFSLFVPRQSVAV